MQRYDLSDLTVGLTKEFVFDLDEAKMRKFLEITGDVNPLHNDLEYAKKHGFNEKVVYGMLTASALSTLAGVYLPGEKSLIHSVEISFLKPVFLSACPLRVSGEIVEIDERFRRIVLKVIIRNALDEKVARGMMKVGLVEDDK